MRLALDLNLTGGTYTLGPLADGHSDGEEILGIGDQGSGGILISVAKLVLTTICAGIHPNRTLPVVLDCGTANEQLLNDPMYLGLREKRVRGDKYDHFVDTFIKSARTLFPKAYIHFEDFGLPNGKFLSLLSTEFSRMLTWRLTRPLSTSHPRHLPPQHPLFQ